MLSYGLNYPRYEIAVFLLWDCSILVFYYKIASVEMVLEKAYFQISLGNTRFLPSEHLRPRQVANVV